MPRAPPPEGGKKAGKTGHFRPVSLEKWVTSIHQAIQYIEEHLREELTIREIAQQAALSPFYFQKGFAMLCGMTVGDYIRQRRLSAAGLEVLTTGRKIIDIALNFGYDSPDSFTKAFTRFHGLTPAALRKSGGAVRSFAPLRIKVTLEGGQNMDCKIMKKEAFTVLCRAKAFKYEDAVAQIPQFWAEHFGTGGGKVVCGMYGINLDESMGGNEFEYLIADNYDPAKEVPEGFTTRTIPAHTWAVFPCTGRMPQALQGLNQQIFSEWLPTNPDYKIAAGVNVELYSDASKFENGTQDQDYYCEIWIPVEKKKAAAQTGRAKGVMRHPSLGSILECTWHTGQAPGFSPGACFNLISPNEPRHPAGSEHSRAPVCRNRR